MVTAKERQTGRTAVDEEAAKNGEPEVDAEGPEEKTAQKEEDRLLVGAGDVIVDRLGISHGDILFRWSAVTCVAASGQWVVAEGRGEEDAPAAELFAWKVGREDAKRIEAAWRERVLGALKRGEPLKGTLRARAAWLPRLFLALSLLMVGSAVADAWVLSKASANLVEDDPFGPASIPPLDAVYGAVYVGAWVFLVVAAVCAVVLLVAAVRYKRLLGDWRRWELTGDGLAYWPLGSVPGVAGRGERKLLRPLAGDVFTPDSARMNERHVPLRWLSASPVMTPLFMAWGARAQSDVRRDSLVEILLTPTMALGLVVLGLACRTLGPGRPFAAMAAGLAATGILLSAVWAVLFFVSGRKRERMIDEGAELLERLGW
jgi:hypothetical protein